MTTDKPENGLKRYYAETINEESEGALCLFSDVDTLLAAKDAEVYRCAAVIARQDAEIARLANLVADARIERNALRPLAEIGRLAEEAFAAWDAESICFEETPLARELEDAINAHRRAAAQRETKVKP